MGKDYTPLKINGFELIKAYKLLQHLKIEETSEINLFDRTITALKLSEISDIELGFNNTKETILRLSNGGFAVLNGTIDIKKVL